MDFNNLVENRTISVMDLRNGKSINNFKGMFPIRPTSPPTTFIGATSFAPPFIQLQCLQWAMRILCYLTSSQSTGMPSPDVPARQSNGAVGNTSDYLVSLSALSHSANVTSSLQPYTYSSSITPPPHKVHHSPNIIKLSQYHQAEPASQSVVVTLYAMVAYFNLSESPALHSFPFYLGDIPKQWYFKLNDSMKFFCKA